MIVFQHHHRTISSEGYICPALELPKTASRLLLRRSRLSRNLRDYLPPRLYAPKMLSPDEATIVPLKTGTWE
jgi:hypothetical protein